MSRAKTLVESNSLQEVISNLNAEIKKIRGTSMKGLLNGVILIRRDMDRVPPLIPVKTGNLRQSWTVMSAYENGKPVVVAGFTADYALWAHEMVTAVDWTRPDSGAKFYEAAIKRNYAQFLEEIRKAAQIR